MSVQDLHKLSVVACQERLMELLEEQFRLRMQHATGQLAHTTRLRTVRREIARVRTVMTQKSRVEQ